MYRETTEKLLEFIEKSPTAFQAVDEMKKRFTEGGFQVLSEREHWNLIPGGKYVVTRNNSALIAFAIPEDPPFAFHIMASHSDSPTFKIKENPEMKVDGSYVKLNVEKYGGMLMAPWFDRPLSVAGRVMVKQKDGTIAMKLVNADRDLLMIPSLAIHMNRDANNGYSYNAQTDMLPVLGDASAKGQLGKIIAKAAGVREKEILGSDLFLYNRDRACVWGASQEYISSARLDDLECCFGSFTGFLPAENETHVTLHCVFDNEEVGSGTKQGAASTFLKDTLERVNDGLGRSREEYHTALAQSFMVSADNAHAVHPNHSDKADPVNRPQMNKGIVIKYNANQKYTTDAVSEAAFRSICDDAKVPYQMFTNRSDIAGGSTLGNISNTQVAVNTVDIGLSQLAMHSPYETAGSKDPQYLAQCAEAFYHANIRLSGV